MSVIVELNLSLAENEMRNVETIVNVVKFLGSLYLVLLNLHQVLNCPDKVSLRFKLLINHALSFTGRFTRSCFMNCGLKSTTTTEALVKG